MLGATISTPVSWGETPEERCKRETEAYNRLWQEDWIRNHPKETGIAVGLRHDDDTPAIIADCVTKARRATYIPGAAKHPNNVPPANRNTQGNDLVFFNRPHRTKRGTK